MNPYKVYLAQTDTTVGFLSRDALALSSAKERAASKPHLFTVNRFEKLTKLARIPNVHKKRVRRSHKTTFVYPNNKAIRVVSAESRHAHFLKHFDYLYSTSANKHQCSFDREFAFEKADIIIEDRDGLYEGKSSNIFKLGKNRIQRLR